MAAYINPKDEEVTRGLEWESKTITMGDMLRINLETNDAASVLAEYRDWMLGGKYCEWKYSKNKLTGDLTLYRR